MRKAEQRKASDALPGHNTGYSVTYSMGGGFSPSLVRPQSLLDLYARYNGILWEEGKHKGNVAAFIHEIHDTIGGTTFTDFSQGIVDDVISSLRQHGNSNATINRKMAALSKLLRKAYRMGELHSLPEFRRQKERAGRIRFLERDEENRLFASIRKKSELYYHLSVFLVDTGARLGEAIGIRWNDIHQGKVTFWLTKSGRSRSVPLTTRAKLAIAERKGRRIGPFTGIEQHKFRFVWNDAKAEIGLNDDSDVVPHVLRHTCASRLVRGGVDMRRVQMWLGHQTLQMTMRYAHLTTHDLDMCVPILERQE